MRIRITRSGMDQAVVFVAMGILAAALLSVLLPGPVALVSALGNLLLLGGMVGGMAWFANHLWVRKWRRARRIERIRMARLMREREPDPPEP